MYDTIHTPDYFSDLQYLTNGAAQGAAGDVPLPDLAQLLLFTLSIHGNTRLAQYGKIHKFSWRARFFAMHIYNTSCVWYG